MNKLIRAQGIGPALVCLVIGQLFGCADDSGDIDAAQDAAADAVIATDVAGPSFTDAAADAPEELSVEPNTAGLTLEAFEGLANWNDYAATADPRVACPVNDDALGTCTHFGAMRRARVAQASCTGLNVTDDLGVFDWRCEDTDGDAVFVSHLRPDRGLADLVTATGWKPNRVRLSGKAQGTTALRVWWKNPIRPLPANGEKCTPSVGVECDVESNPAKLMEAGAIYVSAVDQRSLGYRIAADGISVVTLGTSVVSLVNEGVSFVYPPGDPKPPNFTTLFEVNNQQRIWIEGSFDRRAANGATLGLWAVKMKHSHIRRTAWGNFGNASIEIWDCHANTFFDLRIANSGYALYVEALSSFNSFVGVTVSSSVNTATIGLGTKNNIVAGASVFRGGSAALVSGQNNLLANVLVHGGTGGVYFFRGENASLYQAAFLDLSGPTLNSEDAIGAAISGKILIGPNKPLCKTGTGIQPPFDTDCKVLNQPVNLSPFTLIQGATGTNSFLGDVTEDDVNSSDVAGKASFRDDLNWWPLQNNERAWGSDVTGPITAYTFQCSPQNTSCVIFDWSPHTGDTVVRNATGSASIPAGPFVIGQPCPAAAQGTQTLYDSSASLTFLRSALEALGDGVGNDNGLCESNEACIYAPNFGAYQGHGTLGTCNFVNGVARDPMNVTGVLLYGYALNGR